MNKKIVIVLATYNPNIDFLRKQIDSIKKQTYLSWTCVIIDDYSTEASFVAIQNLIEDDQRFTLNRNEANLHSYHAFEQGLLKIPEDTELICFCDQDDIWLENKLEILAKEFIEDNVFCVHSDLALIDAADKLLHKSCWNYEKRNTQVYDPMLLILRNTITGCSMMFRRKVLNLALPFPQQTLKNAFHHDLWIALICLYYGQIKPINNQLVLYRQHNNNVVGSQGSNYKTFFLNLFNKPDPVKELRERCIFQWQSKEQLAKFFLKRTNYKENNYFNGSTRQLLSLGLKSIFYNYKALRFIIYCIFGKI